MWQCLLHQLFAEVIALKILRKAGTGQFFLQSLWTWLQLIIATPFESFILNLVWQYGTYVPQHLHVVNLFYNFEAMLTKYYHTTLNNPHLRFFAKLTQRWCNVVISTSRRRCEFDVASMNFKHWISVAVTTSTGYCWGELTIQRWGNVFTTFDVVVLTLSRRCETDVAISTLQQRQYNIVYCELNLLFNRSVTL